MSIRENGKKFVDVCARTELAYGAASTSFVSFHPLDAGMQPKLLQDVGIWEKKRPGASLETKSLLARAAAKGMRKLLHFQPVIGLKCVLNFQKWTYLYLCMYIYI